MEIKTYRAPSMQEALAMVRQELGPEAAVLHTREVNGSRLLRWIPGLRKIEVTASRDVNVAPRLPQRPEKVGWAMPTREATSVGTAHSTPVDRARRDLADELKTQLSDLQAQVAALCERTKSSGRAEVPQELFQVYTDLIEADIAEGLARELVERLRTSAPRQELADPEFAKARLAGMIEAEIAVAGPIRITAGRRRVAALVGPTGVGKTTTIAKLAANFRLREKRRVGLITVDTYRVAAVEQLRTYADIIDLPMQVVSTPREMREAVARMADLDLILMDTAGRSPRDEVKLNELKLFLNEAQADEVHLVLSSVAGAATLERTAGKFADIGTTALVLTKLDEATGLGNLLPLLRGSRLPLSYVTNGQNVPDDIAPAQPHRLARLMLDVGAEQMR
jgi:flagellar biosynthesis protein FlhF